jgi:aerobic-type carbon monoxide dehydrogenase small subunit (CoxS/CutS family)
MSTAAGDAKDPDAGRAITCTLLFHNLDSALSAEGVLMIERIRLVVDGESRELEAEPAMPLLYALRSELGYISPKFGCGLAQCGACTVHVDGTPTRSCVMPLGAVNGKTVVTLAGLGTPEKPHPLQRAFIEEQVPQCGYCTSGWIMTAAAFLRETPKPDDRQIRQALAGVKCRCGTHMAILRAVKRAAGQDV